MKTSILSFLLFTPAIFALPITIAFNGVTLTGVAGNVVPALAPLETAPKIRIGNVEAAISFAGLIPNAIGLYQINLVVPAVAAGEHPLTILDSAGNVLSQRYLISVQ